SGTSHPKIMTTEEEKLRYQKLVTNMEELSESRDNFDTLGVKKLLGKIVNGYKPEKDIVDPVWNQSEMNMNKDKQLH
ncbi:hypothetical protein, partial [Kaarinaea lacus]